MRYTNAPRNSDEQPARPPKFQKPRKLRRTVGKEELVALTGDFLLACILDYMIGCQAKSNDIEEYIEEERRRMAQKGQHIEGWASNRGWFYKSTRQASEETMIGLSPSNMGKRLEKLADMDLIDQRDPEPGAAYTTKYYRVSVAKIDALLREMGYFLDGWLITQVRPDDGGADGGHETAPPVFDSQKPFSETERPFSESKTAASKTKSNQVITSRSLHLSDKHQQQQTPKVDADAVVSPKKEKPVKAPRFAAPLPIPKIQTMEVQPETLPGFAATETPAPSSDQTPGAALHQRLLELETQNALKPTIAATCARFDLTWPQIAGELLETMPEREMTVPQLIERLNQDFAAAGLDEQVKKFVAVREVKKDATAVAWQLCVWKSRAENPTGIHSLTARFLTRVMADETLTPENLEKLLAPIRAKHQASANSQRAQRAALDREKGEREDAAREAVQELEFSRLARACDAVIARLDADERDELRAECETDVPEILRDRRNQRPGDAEAEAAFERAVIEAMRCLVEIEHGHEVGAVIEELKEAEEGERQSVPNLEKAA